MQAVGLPRVLMHSTATWASGSAATGVLSTRLNTVRADGPLLKGKRLPSSCLPPWRRSVRTSLRVSGMDFDADVTDTAPSKDAQISSLQPMFSPTCNVEGDMATGTTEDELGVFTKFIDEQLLQILNNKENPVRQTVLMTDGTDTRPYRLLWPSPSLIFDVSPEPAFSATLRKQKEKGLKVPRSCLLQHVPVDFLQEDWEDDWIDNLLRKGYKGDAPSAWAIEMPRTEISELSLQGILTVASSLLMKGSKIFGVLCCPWIGTSELETRALLRKVFVGQGFALKLLSDEELTSNSLLECSGVSVAFPSNRPFAFIAQQERLSDAQVEYGRMQMEMAEEVDEEGFEDSW